jgi:Tfp pilus assembly protein PilX
VSAHTYIAVVVDALLVLVALSIVVGVAACMLSSRISREEEDKSPFHFDE